MRLLAFLSADELFGNVFNDIEKAATRERIDKEILHDIVAKKLSSQGYSALDNLKMIFFRFPSPKTVSKNIS